jgi:plasmid stabilization system protein ParE
MLSIWATRPDSRSPCDSCKRPSKAFENPELDGIRMWPIPDFPNHLIFYRLIETGVEIVRVLHSARDIALVLEGE